MNDERDRAYQYAKFYAITHNKRDFVTAIEQHLGKKWVVEATLAWEAIDQYEGCIRPETKAR